MEITEVKVFPVNDEKLKAFVSIVFDRCFMINDIKVIQGKEGMFISMPSRKKRNGEFKDVAHPLNSETRRVIESRILAEYERIKGGQGETQPAEGKGSELGEQPAAAAEPRPAVEERSLEEVRELHLSDSFWSVS